MSTPLSSVAPVRPVAGYIGGKRNLARRICAILDRLPHSSYAEPFVGMGGIFLRRTRRPRAEAINDISGDIVTLFRCLAEHYPYLVDMLRFGVTTTYQIGPKPKAAGELLNSNHPIAPLIPAND